MEPPVNHMGIPDDPMVPHMGFPEILHFQLTSGTWHPRLVHAEHDLNRLLTAYTLADAKQQ
jgi:hypothetical protein